jgi:hypothetical protein
MKNTILFQTALAIILGVISSSEPASAQGARFRFAPQTYPLEQPRVPRANYGTNVHFPAPRNLSTVQSGAVPNISTLFGFNPNFMAPSNQTHVAWNNSAPPVVPPQARNAPRQYALTAPGSVRENLDFGSIPLARKVPKQSNFPPRELERRTTATQHVSARLSSPAWSKSAVQKSVAKRASNPRPAKPKQILHYDNSIFDATATNPTNFSSGLRTRAEVNGHVIRQND